MMVWIAVAIALPVTFLSGWVIHLLYGEQYIQAGNVLMIHIWASVFVFGGVSAGKWILAENLQFYANYFLIFSLIANIILNYMLILRLGIEGAATATLISQSIASFVALLFFLKTRLQFLMLLKSYLFVSLAKYILSRR